MSAQPRKYFKDYTAFVERFVSGSGREALEDFDVSSIVLLRGDEREEAIDVLLEQLAASVNDPRIPRALAALKSDRALPALEKRAATGQDDTAVATAESLWRYYKSPAAAAALVRIVRTSYLDQPRLAAAQLLGEIPGPEATAALLDALSDKVEAVRGAALDALKQRTGLDKLPGRGGRLALLTARLYSSLSSVRDAALAEIRTLFTNLQAGKTPQDLGLGREDAPDSPMLARLRNSVFGEGGVRSKAPGKVDLEAFNALTGPERAWGEQFIIQLIGDGDPRGIEAATALHADWAVAALREVAKRRGKAGVAAKKALSDLGVSA